MGTRGTRGWGHGDTGPRGAALSLTAATSSATTPRGCRPPPPAPALPGPLVAGGLGPLRLRRDPPRPAGRRRRAGARRCHLRGDTGGGDPAGDGRPLTLLLFLFVRHRDPFRAYDAATRRLLLAHAEPLLLGSRRALTRGVRALVHPLLEALSRRAQGQERLARALPVALDALSAVVAASTSARFRRRCLRIMQVADTPALAAAAHRSLAEISRCRLLRCASCDPRGG
ncbi:type 2 DNA topoisomerase 6 subunit B-like [Anser cygnoides]|uniref:type 2 DNA topoisomerase 6 subunit B-like n=1 Tax=Anser cygnoides TaxID=8845 RepID=UPI0034D189C6